MSSVSKISPGDWLMYKLWKASLSANRMDEVSQLVETIRKDERERCAQIVEQWPVDTHYIVQKQRLKERRQAIAEAIRGSVNKLKTNELNDGK